MRARERNVIHKEGPTSLMCCPKGDRSVGLATGLEIRNEYTPLSPDVWVAVRVYKEDSQENGAGAEGQREGGSGFEVRLFVRLMSSKSPITNHVSAAELAALTYPAESHRKPNVLSPCAIEANWALVGSASRFTTRS